MHEWMTRDEALTQLNVQPQTLYAYVSRGRIERRADPADPRRSLYRGGDILELAARRARGRRQSSVAASTLAWGEPVIPTAIATVRRGDLVYRDRPATALAEHMGLEDVAALLWGQPAAAIFPEALAAGNAFHALADLADRGRSSLGRPAAKLAAEGARCVAAMAAAFGAVGAGPIHRRLAAAWPSMPMARTGFDARWFCSPTMSSTRRPSRRGSPPRPVPRYRPASLPRWPHCRDPDTAAPGPRSNPC